MSAGASTLAQSLAAHGEDDVLQSLQLYYSLVPHVREPLLNILKQEPSPRYNGRILSFNQEKKFGFIRSPEATNEFSKDVFCSSDEIGNFGIGQDVTFTIVLNKNNQPQARLLQQGYRQEQSELPAKRQRLDHYQGQNFGEIAPPPPAVHPPAAKKQWADSHQAQGLDIAPPPLPAWPPAQQTYGSGMPPAPPPPVKTPPRPPPSPSVPAGSNPYGDAGNAYLDESNAGQGERFVGSIVNFNNEKSFGFISSPAASQAYGKDVFLSSKEIKEFAVGDSVSFDVVLNKNGQPQARNLEAAVAEPERNGSAFQAPPHETEQRVIGSIISFDGEKHFGFIKCSGSYDYYGKDVFLSSYEVKDFQVGDRVSFNVVLNARGNPQARDLAPEHHNLE